MTLCALSIAASDCTCGASYPKTASGAALQHDAVAVRLSRDLLPYLQNNLEQILRKNFTVDASGEYVLIYLPEASDASAKVFCDELGQWPDLVPPCTYATRVRDGCIGGGDRSATGACLPDLGKPRETFKSYLRIKIADLATHFSIDLEGPSAVDTGGIRIRLTELPVDLSLGLYVNAGLLTKGLTHGHLACLFEKAPGAASTITIHSLDVAVQPRVDDNNGSPTLFATSVVRSVSLGELSVTSRKLDSDPTCNISSPGFSCDDICPLVNDALVLGSEGFNAIDDLIGPALPLIATPLANAALAFLWNKPLELGGSVPVASLGLVPKNLGTDLQLLMSAQAGAFAVTQQTVGSETDPTMGMSIPLSAGAHADQSPCAAYVDPNPYYPATMPNFTGSVLVTLPSGEQYDENYHLAVAISESYLNQAAYAARASGLLCVRVGSSEDGAIATGSFVPTASLLYLLAPPLVTLAAPSAPIFIGITPGDAPIVRLGDTSVMGTDEHGNPQKTSLLNLQLNRTGIEFHLFSYDQYIRVFSLQADIGVGLSLTPQSDGKLSLSIDHVNVDNIAVGFNPFLPGLDFSRITQTLFSLIGSVLGSSGLAIDLPITSAVQQELGADFQVRVVHVGRDGPDDSVLAAYLKVCAPADRVDPSNRTCFDVAPPASTAREAHASFAVTNASVGYVPATSAAVRALGADTEPDGSASLTLSQPLAVQVAVDAPPYGSFIAPDANGVIRVSSPKLWVLGHHTLLLRTRNAHGVIDVTEAPVQAAVIVDSEKPRLSIADRRLVATDWVTPPEKIMFRVGERWLSATEAQVAAAASPAGTLIAARDEAGNVSAAQALHGAELSGNAPARQGCQTSGSSSLAWMLGLFYVARAWRKRSSAR